MGRKVHPLGFRLGVIKTWKSRWYAEGEDFVERLGEDKRIRDMIREEAGSAGIAEIQIERLPNQVIVIIETAKPGIVIGRRGAAVKELRQRLEDETGKRIKVEVQEVEKPDLDAYLVAENIANQLERRISHGRAMRRAVQQAMRAGAEGVMIACGGRLSGAEMARRETINEGRIPRHTLRADIDFARAEALTTYGRIGVKVWIYKGEVLGHPEPVETQL
ncbi:MAG: 30S ribosomal protein S3 [Anaerolineae bacterium]|nr:30S ribosomal protein S3 [Anaerolineae bacterium]